MTEEEMLAVWEATKTSPLEEYVVSLEEPFRKVAEDVLRMRVEIVDLTQQLLIETNPERSAEVAARLTKVAPRFASLWPILLSAATYWWERQNRPIKFVFDPDGSVRTSRSSRGF